MNWRSKSNIETHDITGYKFVAPTQSGKRVTRGSSLLPWRQFHHPGHECVHGSDAHGGCREVLVERDSVWLHEVCRLQSRRRSATSAFYWTCANPLRRPCRVILILQETLSLMYNGLHLKYTSLFIHMLSCKFGVRFVICLFMFTIKIIWRRWVH